jgi:polar amino acid transport system permease protein
MRTVSTSTTTEPASAGHAAELKVVPLRHPGRWVAVAVTVLIVAAFAVSIVKNERFRWDVVGDYLVHPDVMRGLLQTLQLTVIAMVIGIVLGVVLAMMRLSANPFLNWVSWAYSWLFRSVPVLVQLLIWYNLAALYPELSIGVPFGPSIWEGSANDIITPFLAAILGLGLCQAAYTGEVVRGGMSAVDRGQTEAALALGMTPMQRQLRIVLPQAMRAIIPPVGNEVISMLKNSSLVSVIAMAEMLYSVQLIYARNYQTIPLLMVACFWYLILTSLLGIGQHFLERYYRRGA